MNNKMSVIVIAIILSMLITPGFVKAIQEDGQMLIDASGTWTGTTFYGETSTWNIYDYGAKVWGNYITWTRAIDLNRDGIVMGDVGTGGAIYNRNEPSWIMVHDTNNETTWSITETITTGIRTVSGYYHAETPNIYNRRVIYVDNLGIASQNYYYQLCMYNISLDETWNLPLSLFAANHQTPAFYDNYILYGENYWDGVYTNYIPYIYDWEFNNYAGHDICITYPNYDCVAYNYILTDEFAVYTCYQNSAPSIEYIVIRNLSINSWQRITITEGTLISFNVNSMYEDSIGISVYDGISWDAYLIDFSFVDWLSVSTLTWSEFDGHKTTIANTTQDETNVIIWDNYVCYNSNTYGYSDYNIYVYSISRCSTQTITASTYKHLLCDFKGDKIIYSCNMFTSGTIYNNARDDFDIFRTQTELESVGDVIWAAAPFILTIMVMGVIFGALKMFGDSSG